MSYVVTGASKIGIYFCIKYLCILLWFDMDYRLS
jgi:hypothetical protein